LNVGLWSRRWFALDQTSRTHAFSMLLTAGARLGLNNIALGFLLGLTMARCLRLGPVRVEEAQTR
jgi:hypothetical protein